MELIISVLLILLSFILLLWLPNQTKKWKNPPLPPGPTGLPILGSLLLLDPKNPHVSLTELTKKYGSKGIFSIKLGSIFTVILTDPKLIKEAFNKEIFTTRPSLYLTLGVLQGLGILSSEGALWKDQRKLLTTWMRNLGAARGTVTRPRLSARFTASADMFEKRILQSDMESVDVRKLLVDVLGNTINELSFGISFAENDPVWKWLVDIQEEGVEFMGVAGVLNFLPFLRFFSPSLRRIMSTLVKGQTQTHNIVEGIIQRRRHFISKKNHLHFENEVDFDPDKEIECRNLSVHSDDTPIICSFKPSSLIICEDECLLDFYLEEQERRRKIGDIEGLSRLSDKQLRFFLCDMFGAGLDTSLNTLLWLILFLAVHTEEQENIRKELKSVCGENLPVMEDMPNLPYIRATICEIQRIRAVVPLGLPHGTLEDTTLAGYFIPKDTMVMPFQWYIHHDPTAWEDPEKFKPSRFLGNNGTVLSPPNFIPFQAGKRMCPGDEFARMMVFTFITRLISRYEISLDKPIESLDGIFGLALAPPPFKLKIKPLIRT